MSPGTLRARAPLRNLPHSGSGFRCRGFGEWPDARDLAPGHHRDMSELDRIDAHIEHLEQRLATAAGFASASAATALVAGAWTDYFWLVFCGAAGWAALGLGRLALAADDRRRAVDRLVLAGSHDDRCARRRIELASARRQNAVAEGLRDVCMQAHAPTPIAFRVVDPTPSGRWSTSYRSWPRPSRRTRAASRPRRSSAYGSSSRHPRARCSHPISMRMPGGARSRMPSA
jgi:hypothetical protein